MRHPVLYLQVICLSFDRLEFSREWNIPVHHFLRRHVYGASRPYVSRNTATLITFLVSAFGHELVMGCITKKLRGYGFVAQMLQLPIVALQRTRIVRSRRLFNVSPTQYRTRLSCSSLLIMLQNILFWSSMILGLAMVSWQSRALLSTQADSASRCVRYMYLYEDFA